MSWQTYLPYAALGLIALNMALMAVSPLNSQIKTLLAFAASFLVVGYVYQILLETLAPYLILTSEKTAWLYVFSFFAFFMIMRVIVALALLLLPVPSERNALSAICGLAVGLTIGLIQLTVISPVVDAWTPNHGLASQVGGETIHTITMTWIKALKDWIPGIHLAP